MRRTVPDGHRRFAQMMRNEPTDAKAALWSWFRGEKMAGLRFRRRHSMAIMPLIDVSMGRTGKLP